MKRQPSARSLNSFSNSDVFWQTSDFFTPLSAQLSLSYNIIVYPAENMSLNLSITPFTRRLNQTFFLPLLPPQLIIAGCGMGGEAEGGAGEDCPTGGGLRSPQGRPGHPTQKETGGVRNKDEANHHQGRTLQKGTHQTS